MYACMYVSFCRPSTMPPSANAGDDSDGVPFAETGKRFRPTDANKDAGSTFTDKLELTAKRSEYRDFRDKEQASGSGQAGTRREALPTGDGRGPSGRRQSKREVDSRAALEHWSNRDALTNLDSERGTCGT